MNRTAGNWRNHAPHKPASKCVVYVEKIHWITTKNELVTLFEGVRILDGPRSIHFVVLNDVGLANNAFIEVASEQDYQEILTFNHRPKMVSGKYQVGRFLTGSFSVPFGGAAQNSGRIPDILVKETSIYPQLCRPMCATTWN